MTRIQQSVEINAPVHVAYTQLAQFEDYPRFMQDVETVRQLDDTHLHWTTRISGRSMECEPAQLIAAQDAEAALAQRLQDDLLCLKQMIEQRGQQQAPPAAYAAGSEGWDGTEDPAEPVRSASHNAADNVAGNAAGKASSAQPLSGAQQADQRAGASTTQSEASLSSLDDQDGQGRYTVAEEQNFDQQSDQARRVGQMPGGEAGDAMKQSLKADRPDKK